MWQDFQIGEARNICTSVKIPGYNLSENSHEYWWNSNQYHLGGKINKFAKAGVAISNMLATNIDPDVLENHLLRLALSELTPDTIAKLLNTIRETAYQEGRKDKIREIKACLDLD